ncbi:ABC transporter permease [Blastococcus goldschmidtiae]|uniref:ABC transporter permease n=1 Tax=Blastococcus goldschmidtiae TaxID=3075546 RepID=A0ABU2K6N3_9ACTN|nr:ABC transporter permease [Blastococcus sp. DSM 46792]MDT0275837.1 ABC transporter permease [Blastococcus sp. DSM 46792]
MGSSVVDPDLRLGIVLLVLTGLAATAGRLSGLGEHRPMLVAATRATVQLAVVSVVLLAVVESLPLSAAFVVLMTAIASVTAAERVTGRPLRSPGARDRLLSTALPIAGGAAPVVALVLASGAVPFRGESVIPIAGILIGGAMTATSLAGRRLREELDQRRGEVEAALAMGFLPRDAVLFVVRPAAASALIPPLDQTRTVGLVTLPGAFVGVLLGGGTPLEAGAAQLLVLIGLLAAEMLAVWAVTELVGRGALLEDIPR